MLRNEKKVRRAERIIGLLTGPRPGADYFWETKTGIGKEGDGVSPSVIFLRMPEEDRWSTRAFFLALIDALGFVGGACIKHGDRQAGEVVFTCISVIEVALQKDEELRGEK